MGRCEATSVPSECEVREGMVKTAGVCGCVDRVDVE